MRQRPWLRPGPCWVSLQRYPRPSSWIRGGEGKGIRREGNWERKEGKREWRGERWEGKGKGRDPTKFRVKLTPLFTWVSGGTPKVNLRSYWFERYF